MVEVNAKQRKLQKLLAQQVKRGEEIVFLLFLFSKAINFWHVFTLFSRKKFPDFEIIFTTKYGACFTKSAFISTSSHPASVTKFITNRNFYVIDELTEN